MRRVIAKTFKDAKCRCGHVFCGTVCEDDHWKTRCPKCRRVFDPMVSRVLGHRYLNGNRRFSGQGAVSLAHAFCESEVMEARRRMPEVQECVRDDGRVVFKDRKTERKFNRLFRERIDPT